MNARVLFLAPLLTAFLPPLAVEEEIRFRPEAGSALTLEFRQELEMELVDQEATIILDGEEQESPQPEVELTISQTSSVTFLEEILELDEGRVTKVRRTFEEIEQTRSQAIESPMGSQSNDEDGESELEGVAVVFTWDADDEEYAVAFDEDEEGDKDLLEDLKFDIHLLGFLPEGRMEIGATWELEASALNAVHDPGGDLQVVMESDEEDDDEDSLSTQFDENMEGTITCKLADVIEEDGIRLAIIELTVEAETNGSRDAEFEFPGGSGVNEELIEITFDLSGEVRWNLDAGHAMGLEISGDMLYVVNTSQSGEGEVTFEVEAVQNFEGTMEVEMTVTRPETSE